MYYGEMTEELQKYIDIYEAKFGYNPNGELSVQYADPMSYLADIKECIRKSIDIASLCWSRVGLQSRSDYRNDLDKPVGMYAYLKNGDVLRVSAILSEGNYRGFDLKKYEFVDFKECDVDRFTKKTKEENGYVQE